MFKKHVVIWVLLGLWLQFSCGRSINGYRTTVGSGKDEITVVVVHGSPYEMGYAVGKLLQAEVKPCLTGYLGFAQQAEPERFSDSVLDGAWNSISPFISERFKQELKGVADGAGVSLDLLRRAHTIPVVADYACSGVAVWGEATSNGHLYQLRNLDFVMQAHLQDYPVVIIYKPDDGIAHAVATFAGYIGAHTGINAKGIVLGEKGASPQSEFPFDLNGVHFSTLYRDILYDANTLPEAVEQIKSAPLIKRYYFYVGDGKPATMGAVKIKVTSPDSVKLTVWKDDDPSDEMAPDILKNAIYYTMKNKIAFEQLTKNNGSFDADKMVQLSRSVADEDGNLVNVVYDGTGLEMWVAFAEKMEIAGKRPYVHLKLKDYLE